MKILIVATLFLTGCVSSFTPKTKAGAECKQKCAMAMASCNGSSYTCDKAASQCNTSCAEMESMESK